MMPNCRERIWILPNCRRASLFAAQLQGASLRMSAQLQEASLDFAQLQGAWL